MIRHDRCIYYLREKCITRLQINTHIEYLFKMKKMNLNWLTLLKISLEIYTGEMKGFSNVSDFKDARESEMLPSMQELLMSLLSITTTPGGYRIASSLDNIQINTAIEFCIRI